VTEFQSRRELREAERQGLVAKPEQVFDLPTGQISLPNQVEFAQQTTSSDLRSASELLTRKRIREMERLGLLDPLTGAVEVTVNPVLTPAPEPRVYDEVLAETEEPITSSINTVVPSAPVQPTDIFHSMAVDLNARKPRVGLILAIILPVLVALGAAAYMLGIFK
jgi:hypothetical protein